MRRMRKTTCIYDVPFDAYKPVSDAFEEFYATNSLDDLKEAGEKWIDTISGECYSGLPASHKRLWSNRVRKLTKLQDQLVTKNKKFKKSNINIGDISNGKLFCHSKNYTG